MTSQHEWIENYQAYEAVLVCTNELSPWNSDQTSRAFQTYGWADSTMQGDDHQQFTHEATSVTVLYDGGLLAIDYAGIGVGVERLPEAYADLFSTLNALSWRTAEVYHNPATMGALLHDMGSAIPAHLDFDLVPAHIAATEPIPTDHESIVERGDALLRATNRDQSLDLVFEEMRTLGDVVQANAPESQKPLSRASVSPIHLDDDDDSGSHDEEVIVVAHKLMPTIAAPVVQIDPTPVSHDPAVHEAPQIVVLSRVDSPLEASIATPVVTPTTATNVPPRPAANESSVTHRDTIRAAVGLKEPPGVLRLGASAFYFGTPQLNVRGAEYPAVESFAHSGEFDAVIHLHPGSANPPVRWNLLGEIDHQFPSTAEKIADLLGFNDHDRTLVASVMLAIGKASGQSAGLRDVAMACGPKLSSVETLPGLSPHLHLSDARHSKSAWADRLDGIALRLGALLLCDAGAAFFDLPPIGEGTRYEEYSTLTLRELAAADTATFHFVHVDPLDGPGVHRATSLLQAMVIATQQSRRHERASQVHITSEQRQKKVEAFKEEIVAELGKTLSDFASKVKAMA